VLLVVGPQSLCAIPQQSEWRARSVEGEAVAGKTPGGWGHVFVVWPPAELERSAFAVLRNERADASTSLFMAESLDPVLVGESQPIERVVVCLVFSNSVEGRDEEFNEWYSNRHLNDVLRVPGYLAARRFSLTTDLGHSSPRWNYLAVYEVDHARYCLAVEELAARSGTELMPISGAAGRPVSAHFLLPQGQRFFCRGHLT
jgi:hypothetical protein